MATKKDRKDVFTITEAGNGNSYWHRIGAAFTNRDGSLTVVLNALPLDGKLVIRELQEQEDTSKA